MDANLKDILLPIAVLNVAVLVTMGTFFVVYSSIDPISATQLSSPTISYNMFYLYRELGNEMVISGWNDNVCPGQIRSSCHIVEVRLQVGENGDWHRLPTLRVVCTCFVLTVAPGHASKKVASQRFCRSSLVHSIYSSYQFGIDNDVHWLGSTQIN